jgi:hypothetical protein
MNELTPTKAHDIVNKEINVILKGCKKGLGYRLRLKRKVRCGEKGQRLNKTLYCQICKGKFKDIISQEAHDIVNKEINVILKGLEDLSEEYGDIRNSEEDNKEIDIKISHHVGFLKGIISQEATEIKFLESDYDIIDSSNEMRNRFEALKISLTDLQERVK